MSEGNDPLESEVITGYQSLEQFFGNRAGQAGKQIAIISMVPTKVVSNTVTMLTDTLPQLLDFRSQLLPCHPVEVFIHNLFPDTLSNLSRPL